MALYSSAWQVVHLLPLLLALSLCACSSLLRGPLVRFERGASGRERGRRRGRGEGGRGRNMRWMRHCALYTTTGDDIHAWGTIYTIYMHKHGGRYTCILCAQARGCGEGEGAEEREGGGERGETGMRSTLLRSPQTWPPASLCAFWGSPTNLTAVSLRSRAATLLFLVDWASALSCPDTKVLFRV